MCPRVSANWFRFSIVHVLSYSISSFLDLSEITSVLRSLTLAISWPATSLMPPMMPKPPTYLLISTDTGTEPNVVHFKVKTSLCSTTIDWNRGNHSSEVRDPIFHMVWAYPFAMLLRICPTPWRALIMSLYPSEIVAPLKHLGWGNECWNGGHSDHDFSDFLSNLLRRGNTGVQCANPRGLHRRIRRPGVQNSH